MRQPIRPIPGTLRHGFTLIELLVVIAIIAILAAILFPVFAKAREKARQTTCLNNQRQIATSVMMFVQDHDETFPDTTWVSELASTYGVTGKVWDCPTITHKGTESEPDYGFNAHLVSVALGDVKAPSATALTADLATGGMTGAYAFNGFGNTGVDLDTAIGPRHNQGFVVTSVDGSVHWINCKDITPTRALGNASIGLQPADASSSAKITTIISGSGVATTAVATADWGSAPFVAANWKDYQAGALCDNILNWVSASGNDFSFGFTGLNPVVAVTKIRLLPRNGILRYAGIAYLEGRNDTGAYIPVATLSPLPTATQWYEYAVTPIRAFKDIRIRIQGSSINTCDTDEVEFWGVKIQ
ncbi:MAG: prepilin-type N-terminal cleavage/methylation domain-containing protein [Armatimonadota bacterium]